MGNMVASPLPEPELDELKEKLLIMASHAETAVSRAVRALIRRDDRLARQTRREDDVIDRLEMEIDEAALRLLDGRQDLGQVRMITMAMKIAHDLERVGDEATTISRRCLELSREPPLVQSAAIPRIAALSLQLLKEALDAFVRRNPGRARELIPLDNEVDDLNKKLHADLRTLMASQPDAIQRCLNLMVISKALERIADHATNVAEMVVYLCEGRDIRHTQPKTRPS